MYSRQTRIRIFLPSTVSVLTVFRTAHLAQILNTVVSLDAVQMIDFLGKATMYKKEHQPVLPKLKLFSLKEDMNTDIAVIIYYSRVFPVPLLIDQLSRRSIISVGRKQMRLKRLPLFIA